MKGFKLDDFGDVEILGGAVQMINGDELVRQTVESVLSTNKGEWFLNLDEGIKFSNIIKKKIDEDVIRNEILQGLTQVDSSFFLTSFEMQFDQNTRSLKISFTARNETGDEVRGVTNYA